MLGRLLTTFDRTLVEAGQAEVVESRWARFGAVIEKELEDVLGRALDAQAACVSWVMDANADTLLLVFTVRGADLPSDE